MTDTSRLKRKINPNPLYNECPHLGYRNRDKRPIDTIQELWVGPALPELTSRDDKPALSA